MGWGRDGALRRDSGFVIGDSEKHFESQMKKGDGLTVAFSAPGTGNESRIPNLQSRRYSTYTNRNRPSHTTSTKCQYQATASKPK